MVKQRFSTCDVAAQVATLRTKLLGMRLANLYDINPKTYLLKLARSGDDGDKTFLVLESGVRFHTTQWSKDKAETPSNFSLKLRKHLRTRRLEDVRQLGTDRIVDFSFGSGEARHHLILELFSQGNLVLTDSQYRILTLLRSHRDDAKGVAIMPRHPYPLQTVRLPQPASAEALAAAVAAAEPKATLKGTVLGLLPYGAALAEHCVLSAGLQPGAHPGSLTPEQQAALLQAVQAAEATLAGFADAPPPGFVWQAPAGGKGGKKAAAAAQDGGPAEAQRLVFSDFDCLPLAQNAGQPVLRFETLDAALDEFFAKVEGQRAETAQAAKEGAVLGKVEKIRADQERRAAALEAEAAAEERKAALIEYNLEAVDGAIAAVRSALAGGLGWKELKRLIKAEREAGNPVAGLIHSLQLEANRVTLVLSNNLDEEEEDEAALTRPATLVEVDLDLSAHANARQHFATRKAKAAKQAKTVEQNERALRAAQAAAQQKLSQVQAAKSQQQQLRKAYWFEKFNWFITSENYLVVSGRDAQQNELLVKRYLRKGDVYVHAELHGASSTIVKNHAPERPVPPMSLAQAGCACVCRSKAWDAKIVTSAWWVRHNQVSKTAPTGEYLPTGSFVIRGRKNFLPPQPLVMGLAFLFRLDESSLAGHVGERAVRGGEASEAPSGDGAAEAGAGADEGGSDGEAGASGPAPERASNAALDAFMEGAADLASLSHARYSLPEAAPEPEPEREPEELPPADGGAAGQAGRRHLSAHERRLAKKGAPAPADGGPEAAALAAARKAERERREAKAQAGLQAKSAAAAAALARGKRGKAKKAQAKYADQDEEDRQLALQLLDPAGSRKGKAERKAERRAGRQAQEPAGPSVRAPPTQAELERVGALGGGNRHAGGRPGLQAAQAAEQPASQPAAAGAAAEPAAEAAPAEAEASGADGSAAEASGAEGDGGSASAAASASGGEEQPEDGASETGTADAEGANAAEAAEVAALLAEEHVELLDEEQLSRLREIDALTGLPRAGDVLLHALPVCGPYSALQGYKYRLKLQPGGQRKGKAARQALELLSRGADLPARERELLKAVPDTEVVNAMLGSVKISMPGLQKLQNQARSQKKRAKAAAAGGGG